MQIATDPVLTRFEPDHIPQAVELSRLEHWPHRPEDWALIHGLSRGVVALSGGRVVGTAMATVFGPVGMMNMIIVGLDMRGRGLGRRLMEGAMALAAPREWRLVATEAGLPLYRKLGFAEQGRVVQHQGILTGVAAPAGIDWAGEDDLDAIAGIDRDATGADRAPLIRALLHAGRIAVLHRAGGVAGYAALRPFGRGAVAGPVVATDADEARDLLSFLLSDRAGQFLRVDTTEDSGLASWLTGLGLAHVGGGIGMSRGTPAARSGDFHRFALAAQALG
ncbi:GNAT family N-acetyltransferase [Paracoccus denitrificans]|uniref:GNAT family N-acetyltransferase n=1 Tax=Paracoccus denitrificans TaxID=266 RepID=UPI000CEB9037|nr:GNAT family N-acetyltransferase [Paracoccus denitrificans]